MHETAGRELPVSSSSRYAQTNLQLFDQLRSLGYPPSERVRISDCYEFAMRLFPAMFLPSGRPFIDHLVGTASILASLHTPDAVVAAGLIHAAYLHGDFGDIRKGITRNRQQKVRSAVGGVVEDYVARYHRLRWNSTQMPGLHAAITDLASVDREVLLIRLTNEMEHCLDLDGLYCARNDARQAGHQRSLERDGRIMVEMSVRLGYPTLAAEMQAVFDDTITTRLPIGPRIRTTDKNRAWLVAPNSCRERLWMRPCRALIGAHRLASGAMRRAVRLVER